MFGGVTALPTGFELARTTDVLDNTSVPPGLLRAHRIADGEWPRLVVFSGAIDFVFEDQPGAPTNVVAGGHIVIPPAEPHHLQLTGAATFVVEFYRRANRDQREASLDV